MLFTACCSSVPCFPFPGARTSIFPIRSRRNPQTAAKSILISSPMSRFPATCPSTLISVAQDGTKTGLITVEGRVDKPSLANAMILNMNRQGWNLRGAAIGSKTMHLYEKGERYAVIYYYEQTTTAAMEIWVMTRLADGVLPTMGNGGAAAGMDAGGSSSPSFYLTPDTSTGTGAAGGGVHQQGLSQ